MDKPAILLMIVGLPASGKTTVAQAYAKRYGAVHLNSDRVRAELVLRGRYDDAAKQCVYDELLARAQAALSAGSDVVVDSVLHREAARKPFRQVAAQSGARCFWVHLRIEAATARERLAHPRPDSEASWEVYETLRAQWEALPYPHLELQADAMPVEALTDAIHQYVAAQRQDLSI